VSRRSKHPYKDGLWIYQRWDQVSRRSKYPYKHGPMESIPDCGIRCLGGVSIPTNTDPWIYQRWDQVSRRSKYPYKHRHLDIPEVGSGV
jgi:hypothetical protein